MSEYGDYGYDPYNEEPRRKTRRERLFGVNAKRYEGDPYGNNDWRNTISYADSTVYDEYGYIPRRRKSLISRIAKPAAASLLALSLLGGTGIGINRAFSNDGESAATPTPISTSTPESTWTPEPTATATSTPEPTATSTPSPTPTEVPPTPTSEPSPTPSPTPTEVVRAPEAPTDLISRDVLRDIYHIEIIDIPGDDFVTFDFREGAIEHSDILNMMKESDGKLTIVLLDGYAINPAYLTPEQISQNPQIAEVLQDSFDTTVERNKLSYELSGQRQQDQLSYNNEVADLTSKLNNKSISQDQFNVMQEFFSVKYNKLLGTASDEDWMNAQGMHTTRSSENIGQHDKDRYIFLATRQREDIVFKSGNETLRGTYDKDKRRIPNPIYSFPSPDDFIFQSEAEKYPIEPSSKTAGSTMRHELEHAEGIGNEYDPDKNTYQDIADAWYLYQNGDDGAYYITFHTPEGWTVTRKKKEKTPKEDPPEKL